MQCVGCNGFNQLSNEELLAHVMVPRGENEETVGKYYEKKILVHKESLPDQSHQTSSCLNHFNKSRKPPPIGKRITYVMDNANNYHPHVFWIRNQWSE
eukprot:5693420-Amphidinium_carterae.1